MQIGQIIRSYTVEPLVEPVPQQQQQRAVEAPVPRDDVPETLPALVSRDAR